MITGGTAQIGDAGAAALEALFAENRASAVRLRACHALYSACRDTQFALEAESGFERRPDHAVIDPWDLACSELVARYGIHHHRAHAILTLSIEVVEHFPALLAAMDTGRLDERTVCLLARHMRTVETERLHAVQTAVIDWLLHAIDTGARPGRDAILAKIDSVIENLDPDALAARRDKALRERRVTVRRAPDGMADLSAHLTAAEASAISTTLDTAAGPIITRPDPGDPRSRQERRADAFVDAFLGNGHPDQAARSGALPSTAPAPLIRPHITVLAPQTPGGEPEVHYPRSGTSAIDTLITLLSRSAGATVYAPDPAVGAEDTLAGAGRYLIPAELARRVRLRDGACRHPGCSVAADRCDIDHVRPFDHVGPTRGGPTAEANLMCLCRRHHRFKTFHDWRYHLATGGTLTIITSTGHTITTHPTGPLARWRTRASELPVGTDPELIAEPSATRHPDSDPDPDPDPDYRSWLHPGPRTTHWHRRARRITTQRKRNARPRDMERGPSRRHRPDDHDPPPF